MERHPEPKPHQNTVSTYLKILTEKGFLATEKEGRIFKYTVIIPFADYRKFLLKELCQHFFDDSGKDVLELLLEENLISKNDFADYLDLKIELKPARHKEPEYEFANEILKTKKNKKVKEKEKKKKKKKIN